jgi:putative methylase
VVQLRKRQLEMTLQGLGHTASRSAKLEQYPTPADIAADMLWEAMTAGDIEGRTVADLGCGNGILSIGAKLLGASRSVGVDADPAAIEVARANAARLGLDIEFMASDVAAVEGGFDTVLQNPPFGAQTRHADRAFIAKAVRLAPVAYSFHQEVTQEFVATMVRALGAECELVKRYKFEIPYAFEFHRKAKGGVSVVLLRFKR